MKYIDEFRSPDLAEQLTAAIARAAGGGRRYNLMEFCGGHTHAIFRYGIHGLMPDNVKFVHGPGCPVCVLPIGRIDNAIQLVTDNDVILCTYPDTLRVPGSSRISLLKAKGEGGDVRMVYSSREVLEIAKDNSERQVVFFAIGFETTTPQTAVVIQQARSQGLKNFSVFCNHVLTPPAMGAIMESPEPVEIDGLLAPAHVSTVIGSQAYEVFAKQYRKPMVIAGFEPLDVLQSVLMLIRQLNQGRYEVQNEYTRAVSREGNRIARNLIAAVFEIRSEFEWRGLGTVADSALKIREEFSDHDAEKRYDISQIQIPEVKGCECRFILRGLKEPVNCKLFGTVCTPETPVDSCMVSADGACAACWSYGRYQSSVKELPLNGGAACSV